jgi:transcription elongation factor SPT6
MRKKSEGSVKVLSLTRTRKTNPKSDTESGESGGEGTEVRHSACGLAVHQTTSLIEEEDVLEEDDLELLEENTGRRVDRQRLTRIRRIRDSESPSQDIPDIPSTSKRGDEPRRGSDGGIDDIWDDDDRQQGEMGDDESMESFIDDDEQDDGMAQEERDQRRKEKRRLEKERSRAIGQRPELSGIDPSSVPSHIYLRISY